MTTPQSSSLERHAQTLIGGVIMLLVGWVGITLNSLSNSTVELRVEVTYLKEQMTKLTEKVEDNGRSRYTSHDAKRDLDQIWGTLREHEKRINSLEKR